MGDCARPQVAIFTAGTTRSEMVPAYSLLRELAWKWGDFFAQKLQSSARKQDVRAGLRWRFQGRE